MPHSTHALHDRLAVVFDFDGTLAPSSYDALLRACGFDPEAFRRERVEPLSRAGWDDTLARMYRLIEASRSGEGERLTRERVERVGHELRPFEGVPEMFEHLRRTAREVVEDIEVEFYLLTCGFVQIQRSTSIAGEFREMWGSELHFDESGEAAFARQIVTYPEKVRYVLGMAKGLGVQGPNAPQDVYRRVDDAQMHVPLDQVLYVGDGGSDMPTFSLLNERGGIAIGIHKAESAERWSSASKVHPGRRVQNLARADYREGSELMRSLTLSVESICKKVALRKLSRGE